MRKHQKGSKMKPERGLSFSRASRSADREGSERPRFVAAHAGMVGFSFVQSADDITRMQTERSRRRSDWRRLGIIAKVETAQAVKNLPDIIVRVAGKQPFGMMIARGDLAVAIGFERLAEMQDEIL
jgi:pyruvate kinase